MRCPSQHVPGVGDGVASGSRLHQEGHLIARSIKRWRPSYYNSFAELYRSVSKLAQLAPEEAVAEGWVKANLEPTSSNGFFLLRFVSRLPSADPVPGAPDLTPRQGR